MGAGVVEQISLDLRAAYPDVKGFSSRNLWYMKQWYLFYRGDAVRSEKLHQLGAELQSLENHNPVKLHHLGAEMVSPQRIATILDNGEMYRFNIKVQYANTTHTHCGYLATIGQKYPTECDRLFNIT